jgi:pyridoxine 5-phosphate synthase
VVRLSVNVNKVATLRNARGGAVPDVVRAALTCVEAGCHGITVHPRPDGRHIRRADVLALADVLPRGVEFNIEGYPSAEYLALVEEVRPAQATLVPDPPGVLTSNAGWRFATVDRPWLAGVVERLQKADCRVSLFVDPVTEEVAGAAAVSADRIELTTEAYARAFPTARREEALVPYRAAAERAGELGLGVNAGHDLDLENLGYLTARLPGLLEVSIGHALISDALWMGLEEAVEAYLAALAPAGSSSGADR